MQIKPRGTLKAASADIANRRMPVGSLEIDKMKKLQNRSVFWKNFKNKHRAPR